MDVMLSQNNQQVHYRRHIQNSADNGVHITFQIISRKMSVNINEEFIPKPSHSGTTIQMMCHSIDIIALEACRPINNMSDEKKPSDGYVTMNDPVLQ